MKFYLLALTLTLIGLSNGFNWQGNWAMDCDLHVGTPLAEAQIPGSQCFQRCYDTAGCTHFAWSSYNGGTCYLKSGGACKADAFYKEGNVCGMIKDECGGVGLGGGDQTSGDGSKLERGPIIWSDEFEGEGSPSSDNWIQQVDGGHGWGNSELQYYTKDHNSWLKDGSLIIESRKEYYGHLKYTSARLMSHRKFRYGIFEMRAKLPEGRGIWSAFWMLAAKRPLNWPTDGELDIMEHVGFDPKTVHGTVHTGKYNHNIGTQVGKSYRVEDAFNQFHTYTMDWTPNYIKCYIDDNHYFTYEKRDSSFSAWPFDTDFNILLNVAVGGNWGGAQGVDDGIFPTTYNVEYVRRYDNGFVQDA